MYKSSTHLCVSKELTVDSPLNKVKTVNSSKRTIDMIKDLLNKNGKTTNRYVKRGVASSSFKTKDEDFLSHKSSKYFIS